MIMNVCPNSCSWSFKECEDEYYEAKLASPRCGSFLVCIQSPDKNDKGI